MSQSNLHKSASGWVRHNDRREALVAPRSARMEHRPMALIGADVKAGKKQPTPTQPDPPEGVEVNRRGRKQRRVRIAD